MLICKSNVSNEEMVLGFLSLSFGHTIVYIDQDNTRKQQDVAILAYSNSDNIEATWLICYNYGMFIIEYTWVVQ